ncbi:MAG: hypothetical protein OHK0039_12640 [Bacteroidia bacterium]
MNKYFEEVLGPKPPEDFKSTWQLLRSILENGIDWRNGNPFPRIFERFKQLAEVYEADKKQRNRKRSKHSSHC